MVSRCLPHQWCFYCDQCSTGTDNPCVMSPHAEPLCHGVSWFECSYFPKLFDMVVLNLHQYVFSGIYF